MAGMFQRRDEEVFRQLVECPKEALESIYALYGVSMRYYIRRISNFDDDMIQDVVSQTFTVVWEKREEVVKLERPYIWMLRVAKNISLDTLRKENKYSKVPLDEFLELKSDDKTYQSVEVKELEEMIRHIGETELTPAEQKVFFSSRFEGMSLDQIREKHGIAKQTAKNRLSISTKKIRYVLKRLTTILI